MAIIQSKYRDAAQMERNIDNATPCVGENGNWWRWDVDAEAYVDTGTPAQGPEGPKGDQGAKGDTGQPGVPGGVVSAFGRTGVVVAQTGDYSAEMVGAVPTSRAVNGKALSGDIHLTAADISYTNAAMPEVTDVKAALDIHNTSLSNKVNKAGDTITGNLGIANGYGVFEGGLYNGFGFLKLNAVNGADSTRIQIETGAGRNPFIERIINGVKINSIPIATAEPPQIFDLPLTTGFSTKDVRSIYGKNQLGMVHVSFKVVKPEGISDGLVQIATLPEGFRPTGYYADHGVCTHANFQGLFYAFYISVLGEITIIVPNSIPPDAYSGFAGSISFLAD